MIDIVDRGTDIVWVKRNKAKEKVLSRNAWRIKLLRRKGDF